MCEKIQSRLNNFDECKRWYDGYRLGDFDIYNPPSVAMAIEEKEFTSYWSATSKFDVISDYIGMNLDGTKDAVINMLLGGKADVRVTTFKNTLTDFKSRNDVFTYLIHLGYLLYDHDEGQCYIPNKEALEFFMRLIQATSNNYYKCFSQFLINRVSFESLKAAVNAGTQIVASFKQLHKQ